MEPANPPNKLEISTDCIIVGGGIGGAVLALILGQAGKKVILLEKELKTGPARRPEVLARSTLETFEKIGVAERILKEAALPLQGLELHLARGGVILKFTRDDFNRADVQPYSTDPAKTRQIILEAAAVWPCVEIKRGVKVEKVLKEAGCVVGIKAADENGAPQLYRSRLVVGDDGGHSRVRNDLAIPLTTREFPFLFAGTEGAALNDQSPDTGQAWINLRGIKDGLFGAVFMPQPGNRTAFVFLLSEKSWNRFQNSPVQFYEAARSLSPLCRRLIDHYRFPGDFTLFRRPFGHAPAYVRDGAALLGDAVHPVTPVGGQGANMSVADAVALARAALQCFQSGNVNADQLTGYERERRPANQRSLQFSVRAARIFHILQWLSWLTPLVPILIRKVNATPRLKDRFIQAVSQTFKSSQA